MRYVLVVIAVVAIIAGGFFNNYVLKAIDIDMMSNSIEPKLTADDWQSWYDIEFKDNPNTLPYITQMWRERIADAISFKIDAFGNEQIDVNGVEVAAGFTDNSNPAPPSQYPYSLNMQGYRPTGSGQLWYNDMEIKLSGTSAFAGYTLPWGMIYDSRGKGSLGQNNYDQKVDYVVLKGFPEGLTYDGRTENDRQNLVEANHRYRLTTARQIREKIVAINSNPVNTPLNRTSITKDLQAILTNEDNSSVAGQYLQSQLMNYYGGRQSYSPIYTSVNAKYYVPHPLSDGYGVITHQGELQWIYDQMVSSKHNISAKTATEVIFILNAVTLLESQAEKHNGRAAFGMWQYYAELNQDIGAWTSILTGIGDWVDWIQSLNPFSSQELTDKDIRVFLQAIAQWSITQSQNYISPLFVVGEIDYNLSDTKYGKGLMAEQVTKEKEAKQNGTEYIPQIPLESLKLNFELIEALYWAVLGDKGEWTYNNGGTTSFFEWQAWAKSNKSVMDGNTVHGSAITTKDSVRTALFNNYLAANSSEMRADFIKIFGSNGSGYTGLVQESFAKCIDVMKSTYAGSGFKNKYSVSRALDAYAENIVRQDVSGLTIGCVQSNTQSRKFFIYAYPFMVAGDDFIEIVDASIQAISADDNFDTDLWLYLVFWGHDADRFSRDYPNQGSGTAISDRSLLSYTFKPSVSGNNVSSIFMGAYKALSKDGGFNWSKVTWRSQAKDWREDSNKHYVNIWAEVYGKTTAVRMQSAGGSLSLPTFSQSWWDGLGDAERTEQKTKGVDYDIFLEGFTTDVVSGNTGGEG